MENKKTNQIFDFLQSDNFLQSELINHFREQIKNYPHLYNEYQLSRPIYNFSKELIDSAESSIDDDRIAKGLPKGFLKINTGEIWVKFFLKMIIAYSSLELERIERLEKDNT